jgi:flagellar protein FlaG
MTNEITNTGQALTGLSFAPAASVLQQSSARPSVAHATEPSPKEAPKPEFEPAVSTEQMRENMREAIKRLNDMMREGSRNLNFSMDETIDRVVITVKNASTGEVVRQIPDASLLQVAHNIENLKGMLYNEST